MRHVKNLQMLKVASVGRFLEDRMPDVHRWLEDRGVVGKRRNLSTMEKVLGGGALAAGTAALAIPALRARSNKLRYVLGKSSHPRFNEVTQAIDPAKFPRIEKLLEHAGINPRVSWYGGADDLHNYKNGDKLFSPLTLEDMPQSVRRRMTYIPADQAIGRDKWKEYLALKGLIPKSVLAAESKARTPAELRDYLSKSLGDKWILKGRNAWGTLPSSLVTERSSDTVLQKILGGGNLNHMIGQRRIPMADVPFIPTAIDNLIAKSPLGKRFANVNRGTNEYRVHVMNGKVVPGATINRGSLTLGLSNLLLPKFMDRNLSRVEQLAASAGSRMSKHQQKGFYGMDIGISRSGKPFLIETNPSTRAFYKWDGAKGLYDVKDVGGGSGFVQNNPFIQQAIQDHVEGRRFTTNSLRNTLGTGALAGAGGFASLDNNYDYRYNLPAIM